jgi:ABC-type Na+ efflux pump permease subunit
MSGRVTRLARAATERARTVLRIARWEVARGADSLDRRTLAVGAVGLLLAGLVAGAAATAGGAAVDRDIYRIGVDEESRYYDPVRASTALVARSPSEAELGADVDVLVSDGRIRPADSRKGQAALAAFRSAVQRYNDRRLAEDDNESAAFPVIVSLQYVERSADRPAGTTEVGGGTGGSAGSGSDNGGSTAADGGGDGDATGADLGRSGATGDDGPLAVPDVGGGTGGLFRTDTTGSPADIAPPFPFASLVLAFVFLVPMNFVIQAYGSTILNERINRRGELLLVTPVSPGEIVAGKTLPYATGMLAVTALIAAFVGGGVVSVAAVVPVALLFLAATFVGAMFARSFKELTFVTVTVSVFLTTYAFVPAIFTNVTPIALISPLTLVVMDLQGTAVSATEYAFATGPILVSTGVLFLLGIGVYREEDMFTQRPVPLKFLDALDSRIRSARSMATLSALLIPFVFVAELLAVAVLYALPVSVTVPLLLVVVAGIEEVAKSAHVYAGFTKRRFEPSVRSALVLGGLSGLGFFLGEKATAIVQLVGLPELTLGRAAFAPAGIGLSAGTGLLLLLAPLVLHAVTASVTALGARRGRTWYAVGLASATAVHALYNLTVVVALG